MSSQPVNPLNESIPIVTPKGTPTWEFMRKWEQQNATNDSIPDLTAVSGDATIDAEDVLTLMAVNLTPGAYGDATHFVAITIDAKGRVLKATAFPASSAVGADPTATAKETAINGTALTFMRSDAAPAIQKTSATLFGLAKVDNSTIVASGGVISAVPSGAGASTEFQKIPAMNVHTNVAGFSSGFFGARPIVMDFAGTINSVKIGIVTADATAKMIPAVYANNAGAMGALLSQGPQVTGTTVGINKFPLTTPITFVKGDILWIGMQVTVAGIHPWGVPGTGAAFFTSTGALPNPPSSVTYGDQGWAGMWVSSDT